MASKPWSEAACGLGLAAAGGFFATFAWRMPRGPDPSAPGPGVAPLSLGVLLILLGIAVAAVSLMKRSLTAEAVEATPGDDGRRKLWIAAALLAACVILFEPAGFMLATFAFLLAGFTQLGGASWRRAAPAAAIAAGGLWLFFTKLLGVGLPYGLIGEILFR